MASDLVEFVRELSIVPARAATHLEARGWCNDPASPDGISIDGALRRGASGTYAHLWGKSDRVSELNADWADEVWIEISDRRGFAEIANKGESVEEVAAELRRWSLTESDLTDTFGPHASFVLTLVRDYHPGGIYYAPRNGERINRAETSLIELLTEGVEVFPWLPGLLQAAWDDANLVNVSALVPGASSEGRPSFVIGLALQGALYAHVHREELTAQEFEILSFPIDDLFGIDEIGLPERLPLERLVESFDAVPEEAEIPAVRLARQLQREYLGFYHWDFLVSRGIVEPVVEMPPPAPPAPRDQNLGPRSTGRPTLRKAESERS